jgi:hypothetical protein
MSAWTPYAVEPSLPGCSCIRRRNGNAAGQVRRDGFLAGRRA